MASSSVSKSLRVEGDLKAYFKAAATYKVGDHLALLPSQVFDLLESLPADIQPLYNIHRYAGQGFELYLQAELQRCAHKYEGLGQGPTITPMRIKSGRGRQAKIAYTLLEVVILLWEGLVSAFRQLSA